MYIQAFDVILELRSKASAVDLRKWSIRRAANNVGISVASAYDDLPVHRTANSLASDLEGVKRPSPTPHFLTALHIRLVQSVVPIMFVSPVPVCKHDEMCVGKAADSEAPRSYQD